MSIVENDFLAVAGYYHNWFDVVLMNPPFAHNQDTRHVTAAWDCLRPAGRLVAITSPHYTFASDRQSEAFCSWLIAVGAEAEELPEGTFKESGTMVRSRLLWAVKESA